jgi:hypothetical protein
MEAKWKHYMLQYPAELKALRESTGGMELA